LASIAKRDTDMLSARDRNQRQLTQTVAEEGWKPFPDESNKETGRVAGGDCGVTLRVAWMTRVRSLIARTVASL
jgi:hypothetical protein